MKKNRNKNSKEIDSLIKDINNLIIIMTDEYLSYIDFIHVKYMVLAELELLRFKVNEK